MRYLKNYPKEMFIAAGVLLTALVVLIWVISAAVRGELTYEHVIALVGDIFAVLGLYFNIPTSKANAKHTLLMRLEKLKDDIEYGYFEDGDEAEYLEDPEDGEIDE